MDLKKTPAKISRKRTSPSSSPSVSPSPTTSSTPNTPSVNVAGQADQEGEVRVEQGGHDEEAEAAQVRRVSSPAMSSCSSDAGGNEFWDCSVCTFRNHKDAFKCSMCDVRKGTSTRKPRINADLVAAQQAQALTPPPSSSLATATPTLMHTVSLVGVDSEEEEEETVKMTKVAKKSTKGKQTNGAKNNVSKENNNNTTKKNGPNKARLKNVDRSSATYHSITVNDITVVITEFKPKVRKERPKKATANNNNVVSGQQMLRENNNLKEETKPSEVPEVKEATSPSPGTRTTQTSPS